VRKISLLATLLVSLSACGNGLNLFIDEDTDFVITYESDTTATLTTNQYGAYFNAVFNLNRSGNYSIRFGSNCASASLSPKVPQSATAAKKQSITVSILITDVAAANNAFLICAADSKNYKSGFYKKEIATSVLQDLAYQQNETTGGSGAALNSGTTSAFQLFQVPQTSPNWSNNSQNRVGGATVVNGVQANYGMFAGIDVNDGYKLKLFVVDRSNHRVLIFNSIPTSNAVNPDVVVGQSSFTVGSANAGLGSTNAAGFASPLSAAVCANGQFFVSDRNNNRVAGFNRVPATNGASMDFVLGQVNFTTNQANQGGTVKANTLQEPYQALCIKSRFYIADTTNNRVLVFNRIPSLSNTSASMAIGQPDLLTNTGNFNWTITSSYLSDPYQIGYDNTSGQFFIAEAVNNRVSVFSAIPSVADTRPNYALGQVSPSQRTSNQGMAAPSQTSLDSPKSLAFRGSKLAVGDQANGRIVFYDLPITQFAPAATHLIGRDNFTDGTVKPVQQATFATGGAALKDILFDGSFIWAQDSGNNRLQVIPLPF